MAAEEKKSIEISYKANINDLKKKLESLPEITSSEARKMVSALDRQLKQAERASKKSAEASKKAAQESARAAKRGAQDFKDLEMASQKAAEKLKQVGESSGDIDQGFSGVGLALRSVNPQLAEAADGLADAFAVVESLTMGFGALNPMVLAGAAAVGTITLGYMSYKAELEKTKEIILGVRDAQKQLNQNTKDQNANIADALNKVNAIQDQYRLLTGEITAYEYAVMEAGRAAAEALQPNIDAQNEIIKQREKDLALVTKLEKAATERGKQNLILSEEEISRLQTLQFQNKEIDNRIKLTDEELRAAAELQKLQDIIQKDLNKQNVILGGLETKRRQAVDQAQQIAEFEQETGEAEKFVTAQVDKTNKSKEKQLELQRQIKKELEEALEFGDDDIKKLSARTELEKQLFELQASEIEKQVIAINDKYDAELAKLEEKALLSGDIDAAQAVADELRKQRQEELNKLTEENAEKTLEYIMETSKQVVGGLGTITGTASDLMQQFAEENKAQSSESFAIQKSLAVASIAMKTAEAIMAAQVLQPPPLNIIAAANAAAIGAAQLAKVQSQQPSFHMGGVAPDEANAKVLKGEAILSRSAVQMLGGEQGIRKIEQGNKQSNETVVIIQPFKHFGRFARELGYQKPKQTGVRGY